MPQEKTFYIAVISRTPEDFDLIAKQLQPLKKLGNVEMLVSNVAEKTRSDIPPGGSSWHEYTAYLSTFEKFFPHPKMLPFLNGPHIQKNRDLLQSKLKVLRKYGYSAAFSIHAPYFMPEAFFAKYPHLRGPHSDHPRRTRREAFAICVDHPESQQMYREMAAELAREIPEISWFRLATNDCGAGLCWADWLYSGPNGPHHCKHIPLDARVKTLLNALHAGVGKDHPLDITMDGNFSTHEANALTNMENDFFHFRIHFGREDPHQVNLQIRADNPVRGVIDLVGTVKALDRACDPAVKRIGIDLSLNYYRGRNTEEILPILLNLIEQFFAAPARGSVERLIFLRKMCAQWVGEKKCDDLLEALITLHDAFIHKHIAAPIFTTNYGGVSMRHITRPLVALPELLTPEEESYFLPHVFNPNLAEARTDYLDWHGGKMTGAPVGPAFVNGDPRIPAADTFCDTLKKIAVTLSHLGDAADSPAAKFFARMAVSLRIYACIIRSINNFFTAGTLRDRNLPKLTGPAHIPPKLGDWTGDPDLLLLYATMRDELDNTAELIALLENGGMSQVLVADRPEDEDTFLLGPDLIDQLKKKSAIMTRHWFDVQAYMSTPHK